MDQRRGDRASGRRNAAKMWTAEEDAILRELVMGSEDEVISWVDVSRHLSGRSNKDSRRRWTKIKDSFNRGVWSRDEDESLRVAVERFGQRWALVTEVVETRSPDQCQKRWRNALDPKISGTVSWTAEEDQRLRDAVSEIGKNWSQISDRSFPNRSPLSLSNRYASFEQHTRITTPPVEGLEHVKPSAIEHDPMSLSTRDDRCVADVSTPFLEASNSLTAPSQIDVTDIPHFGAAMDDSEFNFSWQDVPCDLANDSMVISNLPPLSYMDTNMPLETMPHFLDSPPWDTPNLSPDFPVTTLSNSTLPSQEPSRVPPTILQASSCVTSHQLPSGTPGSVLVLENLDDETRDAVLQLIWSRTRRTTVRLE